MKQFNIRLGPWTGLSLLLALLIAGAVFLWVGLALALVLAVLAGISLLPAWLRSLWGRKRDVRGPQTIEGVYTKLER